jgi:hypothetical protein
MSPWRTTPVISSSISACSLRERVRFLLPAEHSRGHSWKLCDRSGERSSHAAKGCRLIQYRELLISWRGRLPLAMRLCKQSHDCPPERSWHQASPGLPGKHSSESSRFANHERTATAASWPVCWLTVGQRAFRMPRLLVWGASLNVALSQATHSEPGDRHAGQRRGGHHGSGRASREALERGSSVFHAPRNY